MASPLHPGPDSSSPPPWRNPVVLAATCAGAGRAPVAPGTFGAGVGLVLAAGLAAARLPAPLEMAILGMLNLAAIPLCTAAARRLGAGSDPAAIVIDECLSMPLALLVVPAASRDPLLLGLAFVLHRVFDILKPFPCRSLERLPGGLGIMADDWGAAGWTALLLAAAHWWRWG